MGDISISNGNHINGNNIRVGVQRKSCWYEEEIEENLRWCFALKSILHTSASQYQDIQLLDTKPFGKALVIDGKLQSAEIDEFIYHESLVHPPLLNHPNPKSIFIMGGGEDVVPYSAHIPSYADTWGWVMASDTPLTLSADEFDLRIKQRIEGENRYIDGKTFSSASTLSKAVRKSLENETHVYTEGNARYIYGHGAAYKQH
ncbi:Thermospermine synthase ACAULIS5 [Striga hermonthica]|uniref:Thermospermine synthase ACAULIS5 n=1 Tax=Striga hermonthica TaxID=68872 RepID=A0A9N7RQM1_STRHE|nr:Thermospermine synthase ACAULIS5 [Striga hermonthica]